MKQSELSKALGLSKGQVSKLVARGMPTDTVEGAEAWRRKNLEPMMLVSHQVKKARSRMLQDEAAADAQRNPIDAVLFGVLPQLFFEREALRTVLSNAGIKADEEQFEWFAAELYSHLWWVLVIDLGFPEQEMNLPAWMNETE